MKNKKGEKFAQGQALTNVLSPFEYNFANRAFFFATSPSIINTFFSLIGKKNAFKVFSAIIKLLFRPKPEFHKTPAKEMYVGKLASAQSHEASVINKLLSTIESC